MHRIVVVAVLAAAAVLLFDPMNVVGRRHRAPATGPLADADRYRRACAAGDREGCSLLETLGARYLAGKGVARDPSLGVDLLERACALGRAPSCLRALAARESGDDAVRDPARAAALARRACELGERTACR